MRRMSALGMICAAIAFANSAQAGNILVNPGFEEGGLAPWYQSLDFGGPVDWTIDNTDPHSGTFAAMNDGNKLLRQDFAPVATESITEVSFWMRHPDSGGAPAAVEFYYSDSTSFQGAVFSSGTDYEYFNVTSMLQAGKLLTGFGVFGYVGGQPARTFLDDFVVDVRAVPEPSSVALVAVGLIGLVGVARLRSRKS